MKVVISCLGTALLFALLPLTVQAAQHPYYLHALADLREARWLLEHKPGDPQVTDQEIMAVNEIDAAINEIKHASIDDGKDIYAHTGANFVGGYPDRLNKALELLDKVHRDIDQEEDDPMTRGLQKGAMLHVDNAKLATEHAIGASRRY